MRMQCIINNYIKGRVNITSVIRGELDNDSDQHNISYVDPKRVTKRYQRGDLLNIQ